MWKLAIALAVGGILFLSNLCFRTKKAMQFQALYWIAPYLVGLIILSYLGEYGNGKHILTFGWDFLVIAIFSLVIFSLAIYTRQPTDIVKKAFKELKLETAENITV